MAYNDCDTTFYHPYKVLRDHNLKQTDLAEMLGVSTVRVQQIMKTKPSMSTIIKISKTINADIVEFFTEKSRAELVAAGIIKQ